MDLQGVKALLAVAESGSVTRAARSLGYTQSAVSRQLAEIERKLGKPVFDRECQGMQLTRYGAEVLPLVRSIVDAADRARSLARGSERRNPLPAALEPIAIRNLHGMMRDRHIR